MKPLTKKDLRLLDKLFPTNIGHSECYVLLKWLKKKGSINLQKKAR